MSAFLVDVRCDDCGVKETWMDSNDYVGPCPVCGKEAKRIISGTRIDWENMGMDPGFPDAYKKWGDLYTQRNIEADRKAGRYDE